MTGKLVGILPVGYQRIRNVTICRKYIKRIAFHPLLAIIPSGVSLDIYEGQVTALLGHNGAGKTTLIATLTGMTPPTSGKITIYGMDVTDPNDLFRIRRTIGK